MNAINVFAEARPEVPALTPAQKSALAHELFGARSVAEWDAEAVAVGMGPSHGDPTRRRLVAVGVAAALVALIVGLVAVAGDRTPDAPAAPPTEPLTAPAEPLRLLPADPTAYEFEGQQYNRPTTPYEYYAVLARPDGSGGFTDRIQLFRGSREDMWAAEPVWEGNGTFSQFEMDGRTMEFVDDAEGGYRLVQFEVGDGSAVQLSARRPGPAGTFRDELAAIGLGLDLSVEGLAWRAPPDGYEIVTSGQLLPEPMRTLSVSRADQQYLGVTSTRTSDAGVPFLDMGETIRPVTIRGRDGWITLSTWRIGDRPWERSSLVWEERPDQWVIVEEMNPATPEELLAFAESLVEVDAEQYAAVVDEEMSPPHPGGARTTATTNPTVESVTDPPATSAPPTAPPGSVLVTNAARVSGLAGRWSELLELQGAEVLEAADASGPASGVALDRSRVFARTDAWELGRWVAAELGVATVEPFESIRDLTIVGGVDNAGVVVVLGLDKVLPGATRSPLVFGDSVVLGAASVLADRGYLVNAETSRQLVELVPDVAEILAAIDPEIVAITIGTNGPIRATDLDALLAATADVRNVILVNTNADRPWRESNNALLAEVDRPDDNIFLFDWDALADQCPGECFAADGIHLTETGAEYFADRLGEITGY